MEPHNVVNPGDFVVLNKKSPALDERVITTIRIMNEKECVDYNTNIHKVTKSMLNDTNIKKATEITKNPFLISPFFHGLKPGSLKKFNAALTHLQFKQAYNTTGSVQQ